MAEQKIGFPWDKLAARKAAVEQLPSAERELIEKRDKFVSNELETISKKGYGDDELERALSSVDHLAEEMVPGSTAAEEKLQKIARKIEKQIKKSGQN